jgi:phosphohistidine phosphatase SixA
MRHAERDKSSGLKEREQPLTSAGRAAVRLVARALSEAHAGSLGAIIASPFNPALETAKLVADELHGPTVVEWDELSPDDSGDGLRSRLEKLMHDMTAPLGILAVGHQPRLNQLIHAWTRKEVQINYAGACCLDVNLNERTASIVAKIDPSDLARSRNGGNQTSRAQIPAIPKQWMDANRNLSFIADLTKDLDTIAQLEGKSPIIGDDLVQFVKRVSSTCEKAYDHFLEPLAKVARLAAPPKGKQYDDLMKELADAYSHDWFKNVSKICDELEALRIEFGEALNKHNEAAKRGLHTMFDAIQYRERTFERNIAETAGKVERLLRDSQSSGNVTPAANAASDARDIIRRRLSEMRVAVNLIIGSAKDGSKLLEGRAESVLREDPYAFLKYGSLMLVTFASLGAGIARVVPFYMFPLVTGFALTGAVVISAFQLKASGKLSEANFLTLMKLALLKFFAPLMKSHPGEGDHKEPSQPGEP